MNEMWEDKESRDKLSKNNAKSLATLRQRVRKYNRDFDTQIAEYKQVIFQLDSFVSTYSCINSTWRFLHLFS